MSELASEYRHSACAKRRPRGRPRDPDADVAILQAALDLFVERGVEGTSVEQVAKRAGVGKLTVYRRWSGKEELIAAAIESARTDGPASAGLPDDVPAAEVVAAAVPAIARAVVQPRFRALVARVLGTSHSHPEIMATYWKHHVERRRAATRALLERARAEGMLPEHTDPDVVTDMLAGAVLYRLAQPGPLDFAQMQRYLTALYVQVGLVPPA